MSRIFLSHSSRDNRQAVALKQWLVEQRPELADEIFLDIDPESGLQLGARWKGQLFESNSRCEAVICLVSRAWDASHGARPSTAPPKDWASRSSWRAWKTSVIAISPRSGSAAICSPQAPDRDRGGWWAPVRFDTAALYALRKAIEATGVGPENFVWPPKQDRQRVPYRGWEPFEDIDAGVFSVGMRRLCAGWTSCGRCGCRG